MKMKIVMVILGLIFVLSGTAFAQWTQIPGATPDSPTAVFATVYGQPAIVTLVVGGDGSPYVSVYATGLGVYLIWTNIGCNSADVFDPWLRLSGWLGHHPSLVYNNGGDVRIGGPGDIFILVQGGGNTIWRGSLIGLMVEAGCGP
jgi:hypothetical protein